MTITCTINPRIGSLEKSINALTLKLERITTPTLTKLLATSIVANNCSGDSRFFSR